MGTIIGRSGLKIKAIQDSSGARMVASKEMLPQSTERIVEVQGSPEAIGRAVEEIGKCLLEDWERGLGTVLFHPGPNDERSGGNRRSSHSYSSSYTGSRRNGGNGEANTRPRASSPGSPTTAHLPVSTQPAANLRTQNIIISSDMVGGIIGRNGIKITEIRRLSGAKISIAKVPHDDTGERMFTIVGTSEAIEKALFLMYNQLEIEKERTATVSLTAAKSGPSSTSLEGQLEYGKDVDAEMPKSIEDGKDGKDKSKDSLRINTTFIRSPTSDKRRRPGPLDLSGATSPASSVTSLASSVAALANVIADIATVPYPEGFHSPHPDLNQDMKNSKFRYH